MNDEKYILAEFKRWLAKSMESDMAEKGYISNIAKEMVLARLAAIEADAVLGEETDEGLPFGDEEVD